MSGRFIRNGAAVDRASAYFKFFHAALRRYRFMIVQQECAPLILVKPH
jgi:hypothetical protein